MKYSVSAKKLAAIITATGKATLNDLKLPHQSPCPHCNKKTVYYWGDGKYVCRWCDWSIKA